MHIAIVLYLFGITLGQDLSVLDDYHFPIIESWRNDCSKKAIQQIIPQCMQGIEAITPSQQKAVAIELSICEFENVNIPFPRECKTKNDDDDFDLCLLLLEKSPQYWTTFSGYYREIKNICHQISVPFEKDQILSVYENITELYKVLMDEMNKSQEHSEEMQNGLKSKFDKLIQIIDVIIAERDQNRDDLNESFNTFKENFENSLNNAVVILKNTYDGTNTNLKEMESHLSYFASDFLQVHHLMKEKYLDIQQQQLEIQQGNMKVSESIANVLDVVENIHSHAKEAQVESKNLAISVRNQLEYSEFAVSLLNSNIDQSIQNLMLQQEYINIQGPMILDKITEMLISQINDSASDVVSSLELSLTSALDKIHCKMNETEQAIDVMNLKALKVVDFVASCTAYLTSWRNIPSSVGMWIYQLGHKMNIFGKFIRLGSYVFVGIAGICILLLLKRSLVYSIIRSFFQIGIFILPIPIGIISALMIVKSFPSIEIS
ncbi:KAR5 Nuclear fusion protein KAR5 [Candida maltosa Xu316]|uniref:Nuclear fusion protein KAR5 n=1 Tax=Candida maltosa (strain Xu316) TaxID=1245528 RepID=M3IHG7_CANMX|nr:hypothetical protein G210_4035 [Candida maltosa Xu316]